MKTPVLRRRVVALLGTLTLAAPLGAQARPARPAPPPRVEVHEATIRELQQALAEGRTTSVELVQAYLARIAAYDSGGPAINAIIRVNPRARAEAAALDAERRAGHVRGPLHGIPVIVKDNYATADLPTTAGSLALATLQPAQDAFVVKRLRDAGAILLAKANMHELAAGVISVSSLGGQTRNPYDPTRCPGGSSGGTGAAIAASFAAVGWGTDTCGSIRIPSAFGALVGLRPTQGQVSRAGIIPLALTQDIGGPMARTVADLAIAMDASIGADPADTVTLAQSRRPVPHFTDALDAGALRGARLGVLLNYVRGSDDDIADTVRAAAAAMKGAGATLVDVNIPDLDSLLTGSSAINLETKFDLAAYLATVPNAPVHSLAEIVKEGFYADFQERRYQVIDTASSRESESHRKVIAKQAVVRARLIALMDSLHLDAIVYPTNQRRPSRVGDPPLPAAGTCVLAAHTGMPALTIPAGFTADGLPVGIEFLGRPWADERLVAMAYAFEQLGPRRRPPSTTPPLVGGRAPFARVASATARADAAVARASFTWDAVRNELTWKVRVDGGSADRVQAVILRRYDAKDGSRVVKRLVGPGRIGSEGMMTLPGADRLALEDGRLRLAIITTDAASAPAEGRITLLR